MTNQGGGAEAVIALENKVLPGRRARFRRRARR